jgi:DNA-binding CsgD family transcriptional regulator
MSTVQTGSETSTELRLDYKDILAGRLVIVIQGLPTADGDGSPSGPSPYGASWLGSSNGRRPGPPSSPLIDEASALAEAAGYAPALFGRLLLAAWRGQEALASDLVAVTIEEATAGDAGQAIALTEYAKAVLFNGLGRYRDAEAAAEQAAAQGQLGLLSWVHLELIEAAARSDARAAATGALRQLEERTCDLDTDWALGVRARSAALLSGGDAAEALYREAIVRLGRCRVAVHLGRAQLVYGEWLRRENRRVDAREQLRAALDTFGELAAEGFAERARRELLATGETARRRADDTRDVLTPQEAQIARLARDGFSNPEIGARLYISPRTVQYHLRKVFFKLGLTSRNQLGRVAPGRLDPA